MKSHPVAENYLEVKDHAYSQELFFLQANQEGTLLHTTPADCLSLCQERSFCGRLCSDGTAIPDPNKVVRGMSCLAWEFRSRMDSWEDQEELCAFHHMVGAECGCASNAPPANACGPLCGPDGSLPDPGRQVQGISCAEWDSASSFLYEGYGLAMGSHMFFLIFGSIQPYQSCSVRITFSPPSSVLPVMSYLLT